MGLRLSYLQTPGWAPAVWLSSLRHPQQWRERGLLAGGHRRPRGESPAKPATTWTLRAQGRHDPTTVLMLGFGQVQSPRHPHIGPHRPAPGEPRTKVPEPPATARPVRPPPWQQGEVRSEMRGKAFSAARGPCAPAAAVLLLRGGDHICPATWPPLSRGGGRGAAPAAGPPLRLGAAVCGGSRASVPGRALPLLLHRDVESHCCLGILDLGDTNAP